MRQPLSQTATSFAVIVVVELIVRAALNANRTGRFEALLTMSDIVQALVVAAVLAVVFAWQRKARR